VDWEGKAQAFVETAREMVEEGLMTMEKVDVAWYQSRMPG
jgi:PII-like signaling protein